MADPTVPMGDTRQSRLRDLEHLAALVVITAQEMLAVLEEEAAARAGR